MKLIVAIVQSEDAKRLQNAFIDHASGLPSWLQQVAF